MVETQLAEQTFAQTLSPLVPVTDLDMERSITFSDDPPRNPPNPRRCDRHLHYDNDARNLAVPLEGSACDPLYAEDKPYVSSTFRHSTYGGLRSLQMTLPIRPGRYANGNPCFDKQDPQCIQQNSDRAELDVHVGSDEKDYGIGFNFENPKYFGFAMYIYGSQDLVQNGLKHGVFFTQAWQYGCGRTETMGKCGVPLTGGLRTGRTPGTLDFYLSAHDNSANGGNHEVMDSRKITLDAWHTFIFYLQPNNNENTGSTGVVKLWFDGVLVADYHGDWGCNVLEADADNSEVWGEPPGTIKIKDDWDLRVGMYRPGVDIVDQRLDIFFDNVRLASSKKQADPSVVY